MAAAAHRRRTVATCAGLFAWLSVQQLSGHDPHVVGAYRLEIGWGEEPAFAGMRNTVTVEVTDAARHVPVTDLGGGTLTAEVVFGGQRVVLPLRADPDHRNTFEASIVPTRPGTYAFHIAGRVNNQPIDVRSICSPQTFDCVVSSDELQFPARDPSAGELSARLERSAPRADRALELANRAQVVAAGAAGLAGLALIAAVGLGLRRRR
jgi:hypothetical protein